MSIKGLSTVQMLGLSERWLEQPEQIETMVGLSAAHEALEQAHERQLREAQETQEKTARMSAQDERHDRLARGLYYALSVFIELGAQEDQVLRVVRLRQKLYPLGLRVTQLSYEEQAQTIDEVVTRLSQEEVAWLEQMSVGGHSLWVLAQRWFEAGRALRESWLQRHEDINRRDDELLAARQAWLNAVERVIQELETGELAVEALLRWRAPLVEAQEQAIARATWPRYSSSLASEDDGEVTP